jgi:hypothetical protein
MAKEITNTAASVHARLLNQARAGSRSFNDLLQLYAMERFLHRLSRTKHADRFVLKGALLMRAWDTTMFRTTRDIDLLARASNEVAVLEGVVRDACAAAVDPDGLAFDAKSVRGETIVEDADYPGVRVTFGSTLGNARLDMQIDVGFGDTITPAPQELDFPTLLPMAGSSVVVPLVASRHNHVRFFTVGGEGFEHYPPPHAAHCTADRCPGDQGSARVPARCREAPARAGRDDPASAGEPRAGRARDDRRVDLVPQRLRVLHEVARGRGARMARH